MAEISRAAAAASTTLFEARDPVEYSTGIALLPVYMSGGGSVIYTPTNMPVLETGVNPWTSGRYQQSFWAIRNSVANVISTRQTSRWLLPISCDLASGPAAAILNQRFEHEAVVQRVTPLVATTPLAFGVNWNAGAWRELSDTASAGVEIVSRSDVNGGRWTIRRRLLDGGALTVIADTGIDPAAFPGGVHIVFRFESGTIPRASFILNGVEFGVMQGLAAMPFAASGNTQQIGWGQGLSAGSLANQLDRTRQCVFRISRLS